MNVPHRGSRGQPNQLLSVPCYGLSHTLWRKEVVFSRFVTMLPNEFGDCVLVVTVTTLTHMNIHQYYWANANVNV